jgi:Uncharacterized protein conserved in bacteria
MKFYKIWIYTILLLGVVVNTWKGKEMNTKEGKEQSAQMEWESGSKGAFTENFGNLKQDRNNLEEKVSEQGLIPISTVQKVPARNNSISSLKIAAEIDQLVLVIGKKDCNAAVSYYEKDGNGKWKKQFSVNGEVGLRGISYHKKEGDKKTPAGLFTFTVAFGIKPDPGAKLAYRKVTEYDYWIDDPNSPYYNLWVNSKEIPGTYTSEHLIDCNPSYHYSININSNPKCKKGQGSAVFLHCTSGKKGTYGCVAIPEKYMKILLKHLDQSARILIVPDEKYLKDY